MSGATDTHIAVTTEVRDELKALRVKLGLVSMNELIKRLLNKCKEEIK